MTADDTANRDIVGGHRPPLQLDYFPVRPPAGSRTLSLKLRSSTGAQNSSRRSPPACLLNVFVVLTHGRVYDFGSSRRYTTSSASRLARRQRSWNRISLLYTL